MGLARLEALDGFKRGLVLDVFAAGLFATGMTQNLKQRAYNHNRHTEEGISKHGNHYESRDENAEQ
jgi:hypothetical protein